MVPVQVVNSETNDLSQENTYVGTEDIILDILSSDIDKKVREEYKDNPIRGWEGGRVIQVIYHDDHSYEVWMRVVIHSDINFREFKEDVIKMKIYPACGHSEINCDHEFKIEVIDYKKSDYKKEPSNWRALFLQHEERNILLALKHCIR
ncbi:putative phosphohydrolases [Bacillus sp. TS-2]|nr:putative phosphohydrolases [Bacillus sp. TS-2]